MTRMLACSALALAAALAATDAPPAAAQAVPLEVGAVAPDFTLPGATRHGVLAEHVSLRDYEGKTVVLAFFFRARTRG
jgi:hypothetical protein